MKLALYIIILSSLLLGSREADAQELQNRKAADSVLLSIKKMPLDTFRLKTLEVLFHANRNKPFAILFPQQMLDDARECKNEYFYYTGLYNKELFYYTKQDVDSVYHYYKLLNDELMDDNSIMGNRFLFSAWIAYIEVCITQDNIELGKIESFKMLKSAKGKKYNKGVAFAYNVLGEIATRDGSINDAVRYYNLALSAHALEPQEEALVFVHLAEQMFAKNDFESSANFYIKAIQNYYKLFPGKTIPKSYYDTMLYNNIFVSYCFLKQNKLKECESWMRKADSLYRPEAMIGAYMFYHIFKALYFAYKNDYDNCMEQFRLAEQREENHVVVYTILANKIEALRMMNRFEEAIPFQRKFEVMQHERRSIIDKNNELAVNQNTKYLEAESEQLSLTHKISVVTAAAVCIFIIIIISILIRIISLNVLLSKKVKRLNILEEEALKKDKMKEIFLHNISHEVRIPLTSIIGFSQQLCDDTEMSIEDRKMVRGILKENSEKLMNLVNNVLDVSRLESGKMKYTISDFDLVETCRLAEFSLTNSDNQNCRLQFDCRCTEPVMIKHDQQRMLKCVCAAITLPSYIGLPKDIKVWEEKMVLESATDSQGVKGWTVIIENSPLCSDELESEEQSILNRINSLYMSVIGATYEIDMHGGRKSIIMKGTCA